MEYIQFDKKNGALKYSFRYDCMGNHGYSFFDVKCHVTFSRPALDWIHRSGLQIPKNKTKLLLKRRNVMDILLLFASVKNTHNNTNT